MVENNCAVGARVGAVTLMLTRGASALVDVGVAVGSLPAGVTHNTVAPVLAHRNRWNYPTAGVGAGRAVTARVQTAFCEV